MNVIVFPSYWQATYLTLRAYSVHICKCLFLIFAAGPKDTPMELVLEKTYDPKTGMGMPDLWIWLITDLREIFLDFHCILLLLFSILFYFI